MQEPLLAEAVPHHFCISVGDRDAAIAWWRDVFGFLPEFSFEIDHIEARGVFLRKDAMRIEIFEIVGSAPTPRERLLPNTDLRTQGVKHVCFAVPDVQAALEKIFSSGLTIAGVARGAGAPMRQEIDPRMEDGKIPATAFFFNDPWGSLIEILDRADFPV